MAQLFADIEWSRGTGKAKDKDRIVLTIEHEHQVRMGLIPSAAYDSTLGKWTLPLQWSACLSMYTEFGADFQISSELEAWGQKTLVERVGPAGDLRMKLDLNGLVPKPGDRSSELCVIADTIAGELDLFPHQAAGAAFIAVTDGKCLITDEQGTGKSAQAIAALKTLHRHGASIYPTLVVCPATVKTHWVRQFEQWYPGLTIVKVGGTAAQRKKQLATPAHVYVINYELLTKHTRLTYYPGTAALRRCIDCGGFEPKVTEATCQVHPRELNAIDFATVIVDEAHRVMTPQSTWTRALWTLTDRARHRIAMTGTPIQDTIEDLWALLRLVAPDEFPHKGKFLDRYAIQQLDVFGVNQVVGVNPHREDELQRAVNPFMRRMLKAQVLSFLPPLVYETRSVEMGGAQAKAYREMKKTMVAELNGKALVTTTPLTKATRLMQFASSCAEIVDPVSEEPSLTSTDPAPETSPAVVLKRPSNKITAFLDDVKAGDYDGPAGVVVFAQSKQLLMLLSEDMKSKGLEHGLVVGGIPDKERDADIDAFQRGDLKFILVSIQAGGAGLTLTAADTMVYLQRSWSSTAMEQSKARAHRIGSQIHDSVRIVDYISEGTTERKQLRDLDGKQARIQEVLKDEASLLAWINEKDD